MNVTSILTARRRMPFAVLTFLLFAALSLVAGLAGAQLLKLEKLTDEQLVRLQKVALVRGTSIPIPPSIAGALRLTPAQIAPAVRQVSFALDDGVKHGFARLNDDTGYFLFRKSKDGLSAYHIDKSFTLVDAVHNFGGDRFVELPAGSAQDELNGEIVAWSRVLSPKGVSMPAPGARPKAQPPSAPPPPATPGSAPAAPALPALPGQ